MPTDAQRRANRRQVKNHDVINLLVPKGSRDRIKRAADGKCMTMQRFIREAVNAYSGETLIQRE